MESECLFDICNFYGDNGGAWADLYGDDIIIFGGSWWGDTPRKQAPTSFMPGVFRFDMICHDREEDRRPWNSGSKVMYGVVEFAVKGNVKPIIDRFDNNELPQPSDFREVEIMTADKAKEMLGIRESRYFRG